MGKKKKAGNSGDSKENSMPANTAFEAACAKIQKQSQKHLERIQNDIDLEEDDDEIIEEDAILEKLANEYSGDKKLSQDSITSSLLAGNITCLICIDNVRHIEATWSCPSCYQILHLNCVSKWAKDSLYLSPKPGEEETVRETWSCPNCRADHKAIPTQYLCFCGKQRDPKFDKWLCPHACDEICGREFDPSCGHRCTLRCHPGPCPPCPKTVQAKCYCGASCVTRRCSQKLWSCTNVCNKPLHCGLHKCPAKCHKDDCSPCGKESVRKCNCGSSERKVRCEENNWKCDKPCGRSLSCQNHTCQEKCHKSTDCGKCPNSGSRFCPCGRTKYTDISCTQNNAPTCLNTCEKMLSCGIHSCWEKCHEGDCAQCLELVSKSCRCGAKSKQLACAKEFTCDNKCGKQKSCGHICTRRCCPPNEECPPCVIVCNRRLQCGNHKCESLCHRGPCYPCREQREKSCPCGKTSTKFPCGTNMKTAKVVCRERCTIPPDCHHSARPKHNCHADRCPPCSLICDKTLSCAHKCPVKCHTAIMTKVMPTEKPRGPWEPQPQPTWQAISKPCPPCMVPVQVDCLGGHGLSEWPCSKAKVSSCGRSCGALLPCEKHHCTKVCHVIENPKGKGLSGSSCEKTCANSCTSKSRPELCTHPCMRGCHAGDCVPCNQYITVKCYCQNSVRTTPCKEWCQLSDEDREKCKTCIQKCTKDLECGHRCFLKCHAGDCPKASLCKKMITVQCACKRIRKEVPCEGNSVKTERIKCDDECKKIQEEIRQKEKEKLAVEQAHRENIERQKNAQEIERVLGERRRRRKREEFDENQANREEDQTLYRLSALAGISIGLFIIGVLLNGYFGFY